MCKNPMVLVMFIVFPAVALVMTQLIAKSNDDIFSVFYTQQINVIVNDFSLSIWKPLLVIALNIAVFAALFIVAYRKKGLGG